ncbi:MAG TPA: hypothetical protein VMA95_02920 [Streptosporangiaceae bacterium]|nr:hypothetical protein [Streptosporangiaceae bacterium]
MSASASITRRLAAAATVIGVAAGLVSATAGVAQAAVPNKWGFAFVSKPAVAGVPDLGHQAGSWAAPLHAHTTPGATGQVFVVFPQLASKNGVVHVTAVNQSPIWCQAQKWAPAGASEVVAVRCYKPGGVPVFSPFTVLYTESTASPIPAGRAYGYVHLQPPSGIVASFNSSGAANTVTAGPTGQWVVRLPGLGTPALSGNVQVTAADPSGAAKCEIAAWSPGPAAQKFLVRCYNGGTTPVKTGWSLSYERGRSITGGQPKLFAYTFNNQPANPGPYVPVPPPVNFNSAGGVNKIQNGGPFALIQFPKVGLMPNTVQVSAAKIGAGFCNLNTLWATPASGVSTVIVRDVVCWSPAGKPKVNASFVTYTDAH